MSDVRLEFGEPRHGWIKVSLRFGADEVQSTASYVADCMTDFVYAALELVERQAARPIIMFEEPAAIRVSFTGAGDMVAVEVTRHRDLGAAQNSREGSAMLAASVERIPLARAVWSA